MLLVLGIRDMATAESCFFKSRDIHVFSISANFCLVLIMEFCENTYLPISIEKFLRSI